LASVEEALHASKQAGATPIAGVIVEPIQAESGDHHASSYFFQVPFFIVENSIFHH
jgi:4-aminobutyrate aminotransferase-like enzyme